MLTETSCHFSFLPREHTWIAACMSGFQLARSLEGKGFLQTIPFSLCSRLFLLFENAQPVVRHLAKRVKIQSPCKSIWLQFETDVVGIHNWSMEELLFYMYATGCCVVPLLCTPVCKSHDFWKKSSQYARTWHLSAVCFFRMCVLPVSGNILHVPAKHVLCSTCAGESGCWIVLLGSHTLPLLLMALPHSLLPLRRCFPALLQVSA